VASTGRIPVTSLLRQPGGVSPLSLQTPFDPDGSPEPESIAEYASRIEPDAQVVMTGELQHASGAIVLVGEASVAWVGECRRCTEPVTGELKVNLRERFLPAARASEDPEAYVIRDDSVDLGELARDSLLLALPLAPLCQDDCLGLCVDCGVNRNLESCEHPTASE